MLGHEPNLVLVGMRQIVDHAHCAFNRNDLETRENLQLFVEKVEVRQPIKGSVV